MPTKTHLATFDETALQRLEALVAKKKSGVRLSDDEAFEARRLRNLKSKARAAKEDVAIAKARRKLNDQARYRLGGLAVAAGLREWPDNLVVAGFAYLAAMLDDQKAHMLQKNAANGAGEPPVAGGSPAPGPDSGASAAQAED